MSKVFFNFGQGLKVPVEVSCAYKSNLNFFGESVVRQFNTKNLQAKMFSTMFSTPQWFQSNLNKGANHKTWLNQSLSIFKTKKKTDVDNRQQMDLLKLITDKLSYLNQQTEALRKENCELGEASKEINKEQVEKLDRKMDEAEKSRHAQLNKLTELVKKFEELIQKHDESANSRLALGVAYSSILSLLFAILVFLYQQNQEKEKDKEQKEREAEKVRIKAEELAKKIEKIQMEYSGLINQKLAIEDGVKNLEKSKAELAKLKSRWFSNITIELGIKQLDAKIGQEKIQLQYVLSEIKKLELYVTQQQELEEEKHKKMQR